MKVTIEANEVEAVEMLSCSSLVRFMQDFYDWLNGKGREAGGVEVREYLNEIAVIYRITLG